MMQSLTLEWISIHIIYYYQAFLLSVGIFAIFLNEL